MGISNYRIDNGSIVGTATVHSNDFIPAGDGIPGRKLASLSYVTIHNTGVDNAPANNFHSSLKNSNQSGRQASWHMAVDDTSIWQHIPLNWEAWHCGNSTGNKNSVGIECTQWPNDKERQRKTWENAAAVTALILKTYGLGVDRVRQHHDWSGKNCPEYLRRGVHGFTWSWFMDRVRAYYNGNVNSGGGSASTSGEKRVVGEITILVDSLNVRNDASFDAPVVKTLSKGQKVQVMAIKNGLYKIREGQWCSAGSAYVSFREITADVYEVTADSLNVRKGRGTEHAIVGALKQGDRIAIWSVANASDGAPWGSFRYSFEPDVVGYVHMGYLKKI